MVLTTLLVLVVVLVEVGCLKDLLSEFTLLDVFPICIPLIDCTSGLLVIVEGSVITNEPEGQCKVNADCA